MTAEQGALFPPYAIEKSFTPHRPIELQDFLAGRIDLLRRALQSLNTEGLHVVLFGERGVGKTSLAKVLAIIVQEPNRPDGMRSIYVTCDSSTSFSAAWSLVVDEVGIKQRMAGFGRDPERAGSLVPERPIVSANDAKLFVRSLPNPTVIFFDEFDRVSPDTGTHRLMADAIKLFSDTGTPCKIVLIGVAESIGELIREHESITRHIAEIRVDTMAIDELAEIVKRGFAGAGMTFKSGVDRRIAELSQGYPHYTHLLSLWAGRNAIDQKRAEVTDQDIDAAIPKALENATGGVQQEYERAIGSSQPGAQYEEVLLACAISGKDSVGRFRAVDVRPPLQMITKRPWETRGFQSHLAKFCHASHGPVLRRSGERRNYQWQFINPQLITYVKLAGVQRGEISG